MLTTVGFKKPDHDPYIYVKSKINGFKTIVDVYVDDLFVYSNDCSEKDRLKTELKNVFECKDMSNIKYCLGINVERDRVKGEICLNQHCTYRNYLRDLIRWIVNQLKHHWKHICT
jgi:hypothetical protein